MAVAVTNTMGYTAEEANAYTINRAIRQLKDEGSIAGAIGGKVQIWSDVTLNAPIKLESSVIVDFQGHRVHLANTTPFLLMTDCSGAQVIGARISWQTPRRFPLILGWTEGEGSTNSIQDNLFKDLSFEAESGTSASGIGIHLKCLEGEISRNHFERIYFNGIEQGIVLEITTPSTSWLCDNLFRDIHMGGEISAMVIFACEDTTDTDVIPQIDRNLFDHITGRWHEGAVVCANVMGKSNHFDHVGFIKDNPSLISTTVDWNISSLATDTYVCAYDIDLLSSDSDSTVVDAPEVDEAPATAAGTLSRQGDLPRPSYDVDNNLDWYVEGWIGGGYHVGH